MPRGIAAKPLSDSTSELVRAARKPDTSKLKGPRDITGVEFLNDHGLAVYDELHRQGTDWSLGDLFLLIQAARAYQQIADIEALMAGEPLMVQSGGGAQKMHPSFNTMDNLSTRIRNCLRDVGLRGKDRGAKPHSPAPIAQPTKSKSTGRGFDIQSVLN